MTSTAEWSSKLEQGVQKRDVLQRYIFRITSLAAHIPGLEVYSGIGHIANALSALGTTFVLSMHAASFRNIKKSDLKPGKRRKRMIANAVVAIFHLGRTGLLTWGIWSLPSAALSCISSGFLFFLAAHSTFKNFKSWKRAERKSDFIGLVTDRQIKIKAINHVLTADPSLYPPGSEQHTKLHNDLERLTNQVGSVLRMHQTIGAPNSSFTEDNWHLTGYLILKQCEKTKRSQKSTFIGLIGVISAVALSLAFFIPKARSTLSIIGSLGYAFSAIYRITHHHHQTGYNFFGRYKSQNQRCFERVMRYCVEVKFARDPEIQALVSEVQNAVTKADEKTSSKQLQTSVEQKLVREYLHSGQSLESRLSPSDMREIVKLKCLENHAMARTYLNYQRLRDSNTPFFRAGFEYKSMEGDEQIPEQTQRC